MTTTIKSSVLLVLLTISPFLVKAQFADLGKLFDIQFVKDSISHPVDSLYFNVMKVKNMTKHMLPIELTFELPNNWEFVNPPIRETVLKPDQIKYIPFRVDLFRRTEGGKEYAVKVILTSPKIDSFAIQAQNTLFVPAVRQWFAVIPKSRKIFAEGDNLSSYQVRINNQGNQPEKIKIIFRHSDNLLLSSFDKLRGQDGYIIPPGVDTLIDFEVLYEENDPILKRYEYVQMDIFNDLRSTKTSVMFEKRNSFYDNTNFKERPNVIDLSIFDALQDRRLQAFANMQMRLTENRYMILGFQGQDLNDRANFNRNTRARMFYHGENIEMGIGNNLDFGEELHEINIANNIINNNFSFKYNKHFQETGNLHVFLSKGLSRQVTTAGIGFDRREEFVEGRTVLSRSWDVFNKVNRTIFSTSNLFQFNQNNTLDANFNLVRSKYLTERTILESGYGHDLNYEGQVSERLRVNIGSVFFSNAFPTTQRGFLNFFGGTTLSLKDGRSYLTGYYSSNQKLEKTQFRDTLLVENPYNLERYGLRYQINISSNWQFNFEPYVEEYRIEDREKTILPTDELFKTQTFVLSFDGVTRFNRGSLRFGIKQAFHKITTESAILTRIRDFQNAIPTYGIQTYLRYRNRGFQMVANFENGAISPITFYNYYLSSLYPKRVGGTASYNKQFFRNRLTTYLYAGSSYQFNRKTVLTTVGGFAEFEVHNGWYVYSRSNFNYIKLLGGRINLPVANQVQVGVQKRFDWSPFKQKYHNLRIVFFQDENNNGWMDMDEKTLPKILAELDYVTMPKGNRPKAAFNELSLLTDSTGQIFLKKIPAGAYKLKIKADRTITRQFYAKGADRDIIVNSEMTYYVPFAASFNVFGKVRLTKSKFSRLPNFVQTSNLRITATSASGEKYKTLTDENGNFRINLPKSEYYTISVHNPYKALKSVQLEGNDFQIKYNETTDEKVNFNFKERQRTVKFNK